MNKGLTAAAVLAIVAIWTADGSAQDGGDSELSELKRLVVRMQQQMQDMEERHQQEIQTLRQEIKELKDQSTVEQAEDEEAYLRRLAESLAGEKPPEQTTPPEDIVFKHSGLSLQQLNPEVSVSADVLGFYQRQGGTRKRTDTELRGVELNFQSYLDPFSRLKATIHLHEGEAHVEEAYMTRFSVFENANLDIGRFRQQFGVINRWHEDALDQVQYPLALRNIFGPEGLAQTGGSLEMTLPEWGNAYQSLVFQVTNNENERLFSENTLGTPSLLLHYKNYRDLDRDTYLEFGLSGLLGWNDQWSVMDGGSLVTRNDTLGTQVFGVDLSMLWEPADQALYKNLEWRSELYWLNRDILAPDGSGRDSLNAWGAYSYLQTKLGRSVEVGIRGDYYEPDSKDYAAVTDASLSPLAYTDEGAYRWQIGPYLTWWQSEFVKFRFEYDYADGRGMENAAHTVWLQAIFAAGPHKHERY